MKKQQKVNPAVATPQAPRSLRVGSRARAEAPPPSAPAKEDAADGDPDSEEDPDDEHDQEAHDAAASTAAEAYRSAADAAEATMGSDSAAALQAGEEAHDAAMEAGAAFKSSCLAMRGAEPEHDSTIPPPPPGGQARSAQAIARASSSPTAAAHLEVATLAKLGADFLARTGARSADAAMLKLEAGLSALSEVQKLRANEDSVKVAADLAARCALLDDAVAQGIIAGRAKAFHIGEKGNVGAPLKSWARGTVAELTETLVTLGYKPGAAPAARSTLIIASADGGDEAGLAARAAAAGVDIETRRASEKNVANSIARENSR